MPLFPIDDNGNPIPALRPESGSDASLTSAGAEVLSSVDSFRVVRLLATDADVQIGTGTSAAYIMTLVAGAAEYIKLEPDLNLYAKGPGNLNVVVMN